MKKMKLIKSRKMLTVLSIAAATAAVTPIAAYADVNTNIAVQADETGTVTLRGDCGAGEDGTVTSAVQWRLEANGTDEDENTTYKLKISGKGDMINYNPSTDLESLTATGTYPWANQKDQITEIEIEDGVTSIGSKAFIAYTNVKKVTIGKDVKNLGVGAISQLAACDTFKISAENPYFKVGDDGAVYDSDMKKLYVFPCASNAETYTLPDSVETIAYGAFSRCANLKAITFSNESQLKTIGYGAFAFTTSLEDFKTIPDGVVTGKVLFQNSSLKVAYCANEETKERLVKENVVGASETVFASVGVEVKEYQTSDGFQYILNYPAKGEATLKKASLTAENVDFSDGITCDGETYMVTKVSDGAFATTMEYKDAPKDHNTFLNTIVFPESEYLSLGTKVFYYCENLESIVIKAKTVDIGYASLFTCSHLNSKKTTIDLSCAEKITAGSEAWTGITTIILKSEDMIDSLPKNIAAGTIVKLKDEDTYQWVKTSTGWKKTLISGEATDENGVTWKYDGDDSGEGIMLTSYLDKEDHPDIVVPSYLEINGKKVPVTTLGTALFGTSDYKWNEEDYVNTSIQSVVVPESVTNVSADVFRRSTNLKSVVFRSSKLCIDSERAFAGCSALKQVDLSAVKDLTIADRINGNKIIFNGSAANVYVESKAVADKIETYINRKNDHISYAITEGGIIPADTELDGKQKTLAAPIKDGKKFTGWYHTKNVSGEPPVEIASKDVIYYATWAGTGYSIEKTTAKFDNLIYGYNDVDTITLKASGSDAEEDDRIIAATSSNAEYFNVDTDGDSITITPAADLEAGTYKGTIYVTMKDKSTIFVSAELTVEKALPEIKIPNDLTAIQGQTLADVEGLNADGIPGKFTWKKPETVLKDYGLKTFKAIYTPDDTKNYKTVECEIDVDVMPNALTLNHVPVITAKDQTLTVGDNFDASKDVTATDEEDGDLTNKIEITSDDVDTSKAGLYKVIYKVTDKDGATATKTITVKVNPKMETLNAAPVIHAEDFTITVDDGFDLWKNVSATDVEDGDLTGMIEITESDVDDTKAGVYHVTYKVTDSQGATATKTITVTVKAKASSNSYSSSDDSDDGGEPATTTKKARTTVSSGAEDGTWKQDAKGWWFVNPDGSYPKSSWKLISWNGKADWYHFDENGYMQTKWINDNGIWYYLHPQADGTRGHMYTGWHLIAGKWYYFSDGTKQPKGAMLANTTTPDGYEVGPDGAWTGR